MTLTWLFEAVASSVTPSATTDAGRAGRIAAAGIAGLLEATGGPAPAGLPGAGAGQASTQSSASTDGRDGARTARGLAKAGTHPCSAGGFSIMDETNAPILDAET